MPHKYRIDMSFADHPDEFDYIVADNSRDAVRISLLTCVPDGAKIHTIHVGRELEATEKE